MTETDRSDIQVRRKISPLDSGGNGLKTVEQRESDSDGTQINRKWDQNWRLDAAAVRGIFFARVLTVVISTMKWCLPTGRDAVGNCGRVQTELFEWWNGTNNPEVVCLQNAFFFLLNIMRDDLQKCVTSEERFKYSIMIWHSANKIPYLVAEL